MRLQLNVTVDTNTLDIDDVPTSSDCQPTAQSARSLLRTMFGSISERAPPKGYEPNAAWASNVGDHRGCDTTE